MNRIVFLLTVVCFCTPGIEAREAGPLQVLIITGVHQYDETAFDDLFYSFEDMDCTIKKMGNNPGALFEKVENFPYDAIVLYNFRQTLPLHAQENFRALIDSGIGLTVIHHAIAGFPDWLEYENIIGATYVLEEQTRDGKYYPRSKWKHDVEMQIEVVDRDHPITKGVRDFSIRDEAYMHWVYHDGNRLLLATDSELSNGEIAWTRSRSKTRVFVILLGHGHQTFENENFRKLLRQGIFWTAKRRR
jgi:type 1 glutamine amidotransferase